MVGARLVEVRPAYGHSPAQSGRHSTCVGTVSAKASRAHARRSTTPSLHVGRLELLPLPGLGHLTRQTTAKTGSASARQRMHGPLSLASKLSRSAYPAPVVREMSSDRRDDARIHGVALAAELEGIDADVEIKPPPFARRQPQTP